MTCMITSNIEHQPTSSLEPELQLASWFKHFGISRTNAQRLLYLANGLHLLGFGTLCFACPIHITKFGPRIPFVWNHWFNIEHICPRTATSDFHQTLARFITTAFEHWSRQQLHELIQSHMQWFRCGSIITESLQEDVLETIFTQHYHGPTLAPFIEVLDKKACIQFQEMCKRYPDTFSKTWIPMF